MLLRGTQTAHELLARSERIAQFADIDALRHHLDRLVQRSPALLVRIPRGPGQREDRYMHLLCGPVDVAAIAASPAASARNEAGSPELEARVAALEQQLAELREQVEALRER